MNTYIKYIYIYIYTYIYIPISKLTVFPLGKPDMRSTLTVAQLRATSRASTRILSAW